MLQLEISGKPGYYNVVPVSQISHVAILYSCYRMSNIFIVNIVAFLAHMQSQESCIFSSTVWLHWKRC